MVRMCTASYFCFLWIKHLFLYPHQPQNLLLVCFWLPGGHWLRCICLFRLRGRQIAAFKSSTRAAQVASHVICPTQAVCVYTAGHIHSFDTNSSSWSKHTVFNSSTLVLCRHTATAAPDQRSIIIIGGGMNCFGFGTTFSPPLQLDLTHLMRLPAASQDTANTAQLGLVPKGSTQHIGQSSIEPGTPSGATAQHKPSACVTEAARSLAAGHNSAGPLPPDAVNGSSGNRQQPASHAVTQPSHKTMPVAAGIQSGEKLGLAVTRREAKVAKDALKVLGWLDRSCKANSNTQTGCVCLPITDEASTALASLWPGSNGAMTQHESSSTKPGARSHARDACTSTATEAEAAAATKQSLHGCVQDGITSSAGANLPVPVEPLAGPQSEPKGNPQSRPKGSAQSEPNGSPQSQPKGSRQSVNWASGLEGCLSCCSAALLW